MSLIKQLWLAILLTVILASAGSFTLSTLLSKSYLEEQLKIKNTDNVTSLAISMSQLKKDPITLDLLLSAQFDSGHYRYIGLFDPSGKLISERVNSNSQTKAPNWFIKLVPIEVQAGVAYIQNGWSQFGSLTLESDTNFAYDKLWHTTVLIAFWTLLISVLTCYIGTKILRKIISPLNEVVNQAKAIGENRFITISKPKTLEFKALVQEMNMLSNRIKETVTKESVRLEALHYITNYDDVTGLMNHDYFVNTMEAQLNHDEYNEGALVILRLLNLAQLDEMMGYPQANALLKNIGNALESKCKDNLSLMSGKLSRTEFAVFFNQATDEFALASQLKDAVTEAAEASEAELKARFLVVSTKTRKTDETGSPFKAIELILNLSRLSEENYIRVINTNAKVEKENQYTEEWETSLSVGMAT